MNEGLPEATQRVVETPYGRAVGSSYRWEGGQYCAIHTARGVVGCGIFDVMEILHDIFYRYDMLSLSTV